MRKPILITNLSFSLLRIASKYQVWIVGSDGVRSQLIDTDQNIVQGTLTSTTGSSLVSWTPIAKVLNPVQISQLEIRIQRVNTKVNVASLFSLGVKGVLLQRKIYTQDDTLYSLENEVDSLGHLVRKQVQDFRPELAVDGSSYTFWKSAPQPDPNAVVNFYCSLGADDAYPSRVDRIWIDPVYSGATMNLYYSNDSTVGIIRPRPTVPDYTLNATFDSQGLSLLAGQSLSINTSALVSPTGLASTSPFGQYGWIGGEFSVNVAPSGTVTIFSSPQAKLTYSSSTRKFTAAIGPSYVDTVLSSAISLSAGSVVQFIVDVSPGTSGHNTLTLKIGVSQNIVSTTTNTTANNDLASLYHTGSSLTLTGPLGHFTALVIKVDNESDETHQGFIASPISFISPAITRPQQNTLPTYSLDNAIFVGPFLNGSVGYGGVGDEYYTEKRWVPVWKDWTVHQGFYYLPQPVSAKYLNLEFSSLTPQPYPIYESGIKVTYNVFPTHAVVSSNAQSSGQIGVSATSASGALQRDSLIKSNGNKVASQDDFVRNIAPKINALVSTQLVDGIRNQNLYNSDIIGTEAVSAFSLRAATTNDSKDLASSTIRNYISPSSPVNSALGTSSNSVSLELAKSLAQPTPLTDATSSSSLGSRVPGWWIFPGGQLKIPDSTMTHLTASSTVTEKVSNSSNTNTLRARFPTVSVHRYEQKTAVRDAGLAYFAGLREFKAYAIDYTIPVDSDSYTILSYKEHIDTSTGLTLGDVSQTTATFPTGSTVDPASPPTGTVDTWSSVGTFIKVAMSTVDRGLHSDTKGSAVGPVGLDTSNSSFWSTDIVEWGDTVVVWGSSTALVGLDFQSNIFYSGQEATKVIRNAGVGAAGVSTRIFNLLAGTRVRIEANIFRLEDTGNDISVQLVDNTPITGSVLKEFPVDILPGRWQQFKSDFFTMTSTYNDLVIRLLINGTEAETIYLSDLYDNGTSIAYYLSNDNGANYYESTEIIDQPNSYLVFPTPGNQLKVKVVMYDPLDYAYGFTITPSYLF
jgi:hypothetical protein